MDFEKDEKELSDFLEPLKNQKPPAKIMEGYEKEVLRKIEAGAGSPVIGFVPVLCFAFILVSAFAFWMFVIRPAQVTPPQLEVVKEEGHQVIKKSESAFIRHSDSEDIRLSSVEALVEEEGAHNISSDDAFNGIQRSFVSTQDDVAEYVVQSEEALLEEMSEDLFILEMLGEDGEILGDFERLESDLDLWTQLSPAVGV